MNGPELMSDVSDGGSGGAASGAGATSVGASGAGSSTGGGAGLPSTPLVPRDAPARPTTPRPAPRSGTDDRTSGTADRSSGTDRLHADRITVGYDRRTISTDLNVSIPDGSFTVIVGPNACGKSTLLRALSRLLRPSAGEVILDGRSISSIPAKEVARRLGLLPQSSIAPEGITVADLVARGRYPHQRLLRQWSPTDEAAVVGALEATGVAELSARLVDELSGGQRQRVWVAMVLAQETPILLLDEPTTFLDIAHQIELLDLMGDLNRDRGHTIVAVLHDLNHACRYATHLVAMRDGAIVAEGAPGDVVTAELVEDVFGLPCLIVEDPVSGTPLVVPKGRPSTRGTPPGREVPTPAAK